MVHKLTVLGLYLAASGYAHAGLSLTPIPSQYEVEGVKFRNVQFADGPKRVAYTPPTNWTYSGEGNKLSLYPQAKTQAEAWIEKVDLAKPAALDDAQAKLLAELVVQSLPKGSEKVAVTGTEPHSILINTHDTVEITVTYEFYGQSLTRSVLFCNIDTYQLRITLDCLKKDFAELHTPFRASLCTWQEL